MKTLSIWTLTIILVAFFINASYRKFSGNEVTVGHFNEWGYQPNLITIIAILELIGAILLLFPRTATMGSVLLAIIMIGATYTLISHQVWKTVTFTSLAFVLLLILGYLRWQESLVLTLFQ